MDATRKEAVRAAFLLGLLFWTAEGCRGPASQSRTTDIAKPAGGQDAGELSERFTEMAVASDEGFEPTNGAVDAKSHGGPIEQVQFTAPNADELSAPTPGSVSQADAAPPRGPAQGTVDIEPVSPLEMSSILPPIDTDPTGRYPIDLATALRLAGASNLQIALARERVFEAQARLDAADVLWVPSLNAGVMYNKHDGRLQATEGDIEEVSRNSLFVGGGPALANSPLAGGAGGPRLFVDLALADVLFEPLAARQDVRAADAEEAAVFNDTLLEVTTAYLGLVNAQAAVAIAREAVDNAQRLVQITEGFAQSGAGLEADALRARAELASRRRALSVAEEDLAVTSAELARLLRLDAAVVLFAVDEQPVPLDLIDAQTPLPALIAQGLAARPEIVRRNAQIEETYARLRLEEVRPWLPNLFVGYSAGGFGGGTGSAIDNFGGRGDLDAGAVWSWENLGLGNLARQREQETIHYQAHLTADQIRDRVAAEVAQAYHRVRLRRQQIAATRTQVLAAAEALQLNLEGIRGLQLRPIEAQQAIDALADARQQYVNAVIDYDQAQFELLRAIGQPPVAPGGMADR